MRTVTTGTDEQQVAHLLDQVREILDMWPGLTRRTRIFAAMNMHRRATELVAVLEAREGR